MRPIISTQTRQTSSLILLPSAILLRLTTVSATALVALLHAGAEGDVDARRGGEAEGLGDLDEVEGVDVEDAAQAVRRVGLQVGAVAVFGRLEEEC